MYLYLMRHGEASSAPENPLSASGRSEVEIMAQFLCRVGITPEAVWHSPKLRAVQTAEIVGSMLRPLGGTQQTGGLAPLDSATLFAERMQRQAESLLIVSHMPFLPGLASALVSGYADESAVFFAPAAVACLLRENGAWSLRWLVTPEIVRDKETEPSAFA
ncbi:MAG TPA: phosphohistidine phosphatase SixA [Dissulfurispiraceae bacterium]|nr:phosphohistidine phosphatase SixA [Dissulfurispiraceae bacterium]